MKIKAILFDMDGVLIEAKEWHYVSLNKALKLFGYFISRTDHLTTYDGLPTKTKLDLLTKECGLPVGLHNFINEMKQQYTTEMIHSLCKPTFHHEYALSKLKEQGFKLAVCSNSIGSTVELMMKKSNLDKWLDMQLSTDDVKNPKPEPDLYIMAMSQFNLNPEECLIIEDNENGIRAAKASGGYLLEVQETREVNLSNIICRIKEIENNHSNGVNYGK
jgi:HAD superfamily hydrolase (TIGR01509 family)